MGLGVVGLLDMVFWWVGFGGVEEVWYSGGMSKKAVKKRVGSKKRVVTRKRSATVVAVERKKERGVPVSFFISKLGKRVRASAYDDRNGRRVLLHDIKHVPKLMRKELTDAQIAKFLLTDDAKR